MITGYHSLSDKGLMRDGKAPPANGVWLEYAGEVKICEKGYHFSREPFDAIQYAPGSVLCLVECEDIVQEHGDKAVCRRRKILKRFDATELLYQFVRAQALKVAHLWDAPPVVMEYLSTGNPDLRDAAGAAAWAATRVVTGVAARAAAWDAAGVAARAAAWDAVGAKQRNEFNALVAEAFAGISSNE